MPKSRNRAIVYKLIELSNSKYWYVSWTDPKSGRTKRQSTGEARRDAAQAYFNQFITGLEKPDREITLFDAFNKYLEDKKMLTAYKRNEQCAEAIKSWFGDINISQITRSMCNKYISDKAFKGHSTGTTGRELATLRAAVNWIYKEGWISKAPFITIPKAPPPRDRWLSREEADRLRKACKSLHVELFVVLALNTAQRPNAILSLKWEQVDMDRRIIDFTRQISNKRYGIVPMNATAHAMLAEAQRLRRTPYVVEYADKPVKSVRKAMERAFKHAGIAGASQYTLRHTAITWIVQDGHGLHMAGGMAGHTNQNTTNRYAHHDPEYLKPASRSLG